MEGENNKMAGNISQLVECPRCGNRFELSETFRAHFEEEKRREIENALRDSEARIRADAEEANQAILAKSEQEKKELEARWQANQEAQEKREAEIRADAEKANQAILAKSEQEKKELEARWQVEKEAQEKRETEIRTKAEEDAARKFDIAREEHDIEKKRIEKQMDDMKRQLGQKPAELQGEALEVYLKQQLQTNFPFDMINDIGRGQFGADLTQEVKDTQLGTCGIVVWEAKRTKHWNEDWLAKIKEDADRVGAHLRVIVSEALPNDIRIFALREGVWVSSIDGAVPLAYTLRAHLIESARQQRAVQGKGLKMEEIYHYLSSPRFGDRIQRMVETWNALEKQVVSEERAMGRQWKERRKQLAKMQDSTLEMFTDFSAILGQEIAQVPGLELEAPPPGDDAEVIDQ